MARVQEPSVGGLGGVSAVLVVGVVGMTGLSWPNAEGTCVEAGAGAWGEAAVPAAVVGCPRKVRTPGWDWA